MYDTLRELYRKFWKELPVPEVERQYDEAFRELMRRLEKPERKLVLRLLDTRGLLAENAAFDSYYFLLKYPSFVSSLAFLLVNWAHSLTLAAKHQRSNLREAYA